MVLVTIRSDQGDDVVCFVFPAGFDQPSWRFGSEQRADDDENDRNHLRRVGKSPTELSAVHASEGSAKADPSCQCDSGKVGQKSQSNSVSSMSCWR